MAEESNFKALAPILVFVVLYLGLGLIFEYVLGISMGFYSIPVVVVFMVAMLVAILQSKRKNTTEKVAVMARGMADPNLLTMLMIFLCAGIFVGVVGRSSASSVAYCLLDILPPQTAVIVIFVVSAFVSLAMGTSVGTITIITPIAVAIANASDFSVALCVASTIGGAMFGDNLSFISDTTIAACQGQGCELKDKFRENFKMVIPAAILTVVVLAVMTLGQDVSSIVIEPYDLLQIVPYILVLICALAGLNVFLVLLIGIISGAVIMVGTGAVEFTDLIVNMGSGASGMFETSMVAILVTAICALIVDSGGFNALLDWTKRRFKSKKGGMLGTGILVSILDVACANNTVAIMVANPIAKELSITYDICKRKTASILDTFSCVWQGIIPYGAQMLVAISAVITMGATVSAFDIIPLLFYPFLMLIFVLIFIALPDDRGYEGDALVTDDED